MNKDFQNTVIFLLLAVGLMTFIVDVLSRGDPAPDEPALEGQGWGEEPEAAPEVAQGALPIPEPAEDPVPVVDMEALKEELRNEILAELQADMKENPPEIVEVSEPEPVVDPEATAPLPEEELAVENVEEHVEEDTAPEQPVATREPDLVAMQNTVIMMDARIQEMKENIRTEEQYLTQEKARLHAWQRDLEQKYQDKTFAVTKTRAEAHELNKAVASWRRRHRRHMARTDVLAEAEALLALRKQQLRMVKQR